MEERKETLEHEEQLTQHSKHNAKEKLENACSINDFKSFHHIRSLLMWNGVQVLISDDLQLSYLAQCYLRRDGTALLLAEYKSEHDSNAPECNDKLSQRWQQEHSNSKTINGCSDDCELAIVSIPLCTSTKFTASCMSANSFSVQFNVPVYHNNICRRGDTSGKCVSHSMWINDTTVEELSIEIVDDEVDFDTSKLVKLLQYLTQIPEQQSVFAQSRSDQTFQSQSTPMENATRTRHADPAAEVMNTTHYPVSVWGNEHNSVCNLTSSLLSILNEYNHILSSMSVNIHAQEGKIRQMQRELLRGVKFREGHVSQNDYTDRHTESTETKRLTHESINKIYEQTNRETCECERVDVNEDDVEIEEEHWQQQEEEVEEKEVILDEKIKISKRNVDNYRETETGDDLPHAEPLHQEIKFTVDCDNNNSNNILLSKDEKKDQEVEHQENVCMRSDSLYNANNNMINTYNDIDEENALEVATARTIVHTIEPRTEIPNAQNLIEFMFINTNERLEESLTSEEKEEQREEEFLLQELELLEEELSSQDFYHPELNEQESHSQLSQLQRPGSAHVHLSSGLGIVGPNVEDEEALRMYAEIHGKPFHSNVTNFNNKTSTNGIYEKNCSDICKADIKSSSRSSTSTTCSAYQSSTHSSLSSTEHQAESSVHMEL